MGISYRIGYAAMLIWLVAVAYGCSTYDTGREGFPWESWVGLEFAGLILFPFYFVGVFVCRRLWK
ncbi:hypothetical protein [Paenibacillus ferrarius]|uniref:hypothetical protein n=1 Tax=Paenibacillus ferrarius TaxID=1469647 RepID=UPI003D296705